MHQVLAHRGQHGEIDAAIGDAVHPGGEIAGVMSEARAQAVQDSQLHEDAEFNKAAGDEAKWVNRVISAAGGKYLELVPFAGDVLEWVQEDVTESSLETGEKDTTSEARRESTDGYSRAEGAAKVSAARAVSAAARDADLSPTDVKDLQGVASRAMGTARSTGRDPVVSGSGHGMTRRRTRTVPVGVLALTVVALLGGCSSPPQSHRPEVPARVCWGAFTDSEVEPLLHDGETARPQTRLPFDLYGGKASVTCLVYVDGNNPFTAAARREPGGFDLDWSTWEKAGGRSIDVGEGGLVWGSSGAVGTVTYFYCRKPDSRDKIELRLDGDSRGDAPAAQRRLIGLTEKFMSFAQKELGCSEASGGTSPDP
ncbi:hypothetical protein [Streptomyces sp. NPDC058872]|uniref:hypothetical protein n=1 Tax=Streptomyces sp. NPDC058872 TaxID=3346661 RepID=UPI0036BF8F17